jgi:gamma-glutamyltranspeptidase/glutathione hydrolase
MKHVDLSPGLWDAAVREEVEALELDSFQGAPETRSLTGRKGVVSATVSPLAVRSGIETLARGGNAADAAITTALTGVATALGAYVSYAGIVSLVYYDAATGAVSALDAGYNSYLGEDDPMGIPECDFGTGFVASARPGTPRERLGRKTLVPGYMAGIEALHRRFGTLRFGDLFAPAIHYAEEGLVLGPALAAFFERRSAYLGRTPEGRAFFRKPDGSLPRAGERFRQPETAKTLRAVAEQGAAYMYSGAWAEEFVRIVRREGGNVTMEDMRRYEPTWDEPLVARFRGAEINTVNGQGGVMLATGLALVEANGMPGAGHYWTDAQALADLSRIGAFATSVATLKPETIEALAACGVTVRADRPFTTEEARSALATLLSRPAPTPENRAAHSDSLVVIDAAGNVCAMTHTINCMLWGDTDIVVGGVPIPDSAGFQQAALAALTPGDRLPNPISPVIALKDGRPALAAAQIGSCLVPETLRLLLGILGQDQGLAEMQARPPVLLAMPGFGPVAQAEGHIVLPEGRYEAAMLDALDALGIPVSLVPAAGVQGLRGTVVLAGIDADTGMIETCEGQGGYARAAAL